MPPTKKRKSSPIELDLDALFADLDASVHSSSASASSHRRATPIASKPTAVGNHETPLSARTKLLRSPTRTRTRNDTDLAALVDGLAEPPISPHRRASSFKPITPTKVKTSTPRRSTGKGKGLAQTDLNALIEGIDWDDFDAPPTPVKPKSAPRTPRSPLKPHASYDDLSTFAQRSGDSGSKRRRVSVTPLKAQSFVETPKSSATRRAAPARPIPISNKVQDPPRSAVPDNVRDRTTRCTVTSVETITVGFRTEKHLHLTTASGGTSSRRIAILKDDWVNTDVKAGDIISLIGTWDPSSSTSTSTAPPTHIPKMILSTTQNTLILHPDTLLPTTSISTASRCVRKPLISSLVRSSLSDVTPSTVWGLMLHEIVQECLAQGRWDEGFVDETTDEVIKNSLDRLFQIRIGFGEAKNELKKRSAGLRKFSELYISDTPKPEALLADNSASSSKSPARIAITHLEDIEETIWSPSYGLKGIVDASVDTRIIQNHGPFVDDSTAVLPMEIKTGRASINDHRAQTVLYTLLMGERYGTQVPSGLLYYTQSEEIIRVPAVRNELRGLIQTRNEIAGYLKPRGDLKVSAAPVQPSSSTASSSAATSEMTTTWASEGVVISAIPALPPTIDDEWTCGKCYNVDACMTFRKTHDQIEDFDSPIASLYESKTSHLTPHHTAFFRHWDALISLEEQDLNRYHAELWTMSAQAREKAGRCYADMVVVGYEAAPEETLNRRAESKRHLYTLRRKKGTGDKNDSGSLRGAMSRGDAIILSVEPNLLALGRGFIVEISHTDIVIGINRVLTPEVLSRGSSSGVEISKLSDVVFRIDKDELSTGMTRVRDNLIQIFYAKSDRRLLSLIVDLAPPSFSALDEHDASIVQGLEGVLNESQRDAVEKVLSADQYALILGMPGTGKTTTIAEIIKVLVKQGQRVLLTSYTHSAVDTILRKLVDTDINVLRLGHEEKIHPEVRKYGLNALPVANSLEQLEHQLLTPLVVATTCLSIEHSLFSRRQFDVCIVDEASQITLPTCLGPLRFASRFVLVGDHHQLPPLVRSRDARRAGLDESLFRRLCTAHPNAVVDLSEQYRMNEDIMHLANELVYKRKLRCGTREVAEQALRLPNGVAVAELHASESACSREACWLGEVLDPDRRVVFVDTDDVPGGESRHGDLVQNTIEVSLVHQITEALLRGGVAESQIGLISLYRQQNKLLGQALAGRSGIEILTADRSQGRDKDCIIVSLVRSNKSGDLGELLKDSRRINVTLTRARSKLIIVGSRSTMACQNADLSSSSTKQYPLLAKLMRVLEDKRWILRLSPRAHELHRDQLCGTGSADGATAQNDEAMAEVLAEAERMEFADLVKRSRAAKKASGSRSAVPSLLKHSSLLRDVANDI